MSIREIKRNLILYIALQSCQLICTNLIVWYARTPCKRQTISQVK